MTTTRTSLRWLLITIAAALAGLAGGGTASGAPAANQAPRLVLLGAQRLGPAVYVRFRVCDDSAQKVTIVAMDTKPGVPSYRRVFATLTPPNPCGVYGRRWVPARRFGGRGSYTVTLTARDTSRATSATVCQTFVR